METYIFKHSMIQNNPVIFLKVNGDTTTIESYPYIRNLNSVTKGSSFKFHVRESIRASLYLQIKEDKVMVLANKLLMEPEKLYSFSIPDESSIKIVMYLFPVKNDTCGDTSDGFEYYMSGIQCIKSNKCEMGFYKVNDVCVQSGSPCDGPNSIMLTDGTCKVQSSCKIPNKYTKSVEDCKPTCFSSTPDGFSIRNIDGTCVKTDNCAEGKVSFTFQNKKMCLKDGDPCSPTHTFYNHTCNFTGSKECPYVDPSLVESRDPNSCNVTCKANLDGYIVNQTSPTSCTINKKLCADGFNLVNGECVKDNLINCKTETTINTSFFTKNGKCMESHRCPEPDELHQSYSFDCVPKCRKQYNGFKINFDESLSKCIKSDTCHPDFQKVNNLCLPKNSLCDKYKPPLSKESLRLNGRYVVQDNNSCSLVCDKFDMHTGLSTVYIPPKDTLLHYDEGSHSSSNAVGCKLTDTCFFPNTHFNPTLNKCVKNNTITITNKHNENVRYVLSNHRNVSTSGTIEAFETRNFELPFAKSIRVHFPGFEQFLIKLKFTNLSNNKVTRTIYRQNQIINIPSHQFSISMKLLGEMDVIPPVDFSLDLDNTKKIVQPSSVFYNNFGLI